MTALLIPYGMNDAGRMVHVDDVPRGKACGLHCPSCGVSLIARKGSVKRHHLAHSSDNPTCEGWLHKTAKMLLYQRIADAIATESPLPIRWSCRCPNWVGDEELWQQAGKEQVAQWLTEYSSIHWKDLLGKRVLNSVRIEKYLVDWNIQPDIVCMTDDTPKVIVEIVDTHAPEQPVIDAGLPVLEVHVSESADLSSLVEGTVPIAEMHNYACPDSCCKVCGRRESEGCRYCEECGQHALPEHAYCTQCRACSEDHHVHQYCSECDAIVKGYLSAYGDDFSHKHCEGCGVCFVPKLVAAGAAYATYCYPCWCQL